MRTTLIVAFIAIGLIAVVRAQQPVWSNAIRITPDNVYFDWPAVQSCAWRGDPVCRIAIAARVGQ